MVRVSLLYYPVQLVLQLRGLIADARLFVLVGGLSVLVQLISVVCFSGARLEPRHSAVDSRRAVLVPIIMLMSMLPVSIAGWGLREGAAVVLLGEAGINPADALLLSVLFGLISLLIWGFGGLVWLASRSRRGAGIQGRG